MIPQPPAYSSSQPQGAVVQQHQVVTVQQPQTTVTAVNQPPPGNWQGMKGTGIAQIILGSLTIILGIVTIAIQTFLYQIASPLWCGLAFFVVAGILGLLAGQKKNSCLAIGYMVMSIFACLASCVVIGFSSGAIPGDLYCAGRYYYSFSYYCNPGGRVAVDAMLVILGLVEFVMSIVGASMTCSALCSSPPAHTVIHYQAQPQVVVAGQPPGVQYYPPAGQPQFAYPPQQAMGTPQGQFQAPPQAYPAQGQAVAQAPPGAVSEHQYQPLTK